jgi:hypothetical protein
MPELIIPRVCGSPAVVIGSPRAPRYTTFPKQQCPSYTRWGHDHESRGRAVIEMSDRVPGECAHLVVPGRSTDDNRVCILGAIHGAATPGQFMGWAIRACD